MKKDVVTALLLVLISSGLTPVAQTQVANSQAEDNFRSELRLGELEEIAMCHHAINAAHHDALAIDQNPYYRYILNSPHKGSTSNIYPIPERCKNLETDWILHYTNMHADTKTIEDKTIHDAVGITISDIATDAQFLTVVINKMLLEGDKAIYWENKDKDIP